TGLEELREAVEALRAEHGEKWLSVFVAFYMGYKRTCELADACTLPSLSAEVERADPATRDAYQAALAGVARAVAEGLSGGTKAQRQARAWALLSTLAGGVTMARAVPDQKTAEQIAAAVQRAALAIASGHEPD
ncbi:MAG: TetR/AcrR family transcriptional regulator, partial [Rhodanobacter sp.]